MKKSINLAKATNTYILILIIVGNSEIGAYAQSNIGNLVRFVLI